jgi:hypothetical protein
LGDSAKPESGLPSVDVMDKFCECIPPAEWDPPKEDGDMASIRPIGLKPLIPLILVPALSRDSGLKGLLVDGDVKLVFLECCTPWITEVCLWCP